MQQKLFDLPEHARVVTSFGWNIESFIVKPTIMPGRVKLCSLKHDGYSFLGVEKEDGTITAHALFRITLTNGSECSYE
jgi:hypothetical protein